MPACFAASQSTGAADLTHPYLLYTPEEGVRLSNSLPADIRTVSWSSPDLSAVQIRRWSAANYNDAFGTTGVIPELTRSNALRQIAVLAWLQPRGRQIKWDGTLGSSWISMIKWSLPKIATCTGRDGDTLLPWYPNYGGWGRILEASEALWNYAVIYDLLNDSRVRAAGITQTDIDLLYRRIVDGPYHVLISHLRGHRTIVPEDRRTWVNNWTARELAGVGMASLAFSKRMDSEPAESQRRINYADSLALVRNLGVQFLRTWHSPLDQASYYYEGPHYLSYWADTFLPFASIHKRMYPDLHPQEFGLRGDDPIGRMIQAHVMLLAPTRRIWNNTIAWTSVPVDDSWVDQGPQSELSTFGAQFLELDEPLRLRFVEVARRTGMRVHPLLLGKPLLNELWTAPVRELPTVEYLRYGGIAMLRSGSTEDDLTVSLKNTWTAPNRNKDTDLSAPLLESHTQPDNGSVVAYRGGEPILIDPSYGTNGYFHPLRTQNFMAWTQHNVVTLEGTGYRDDTKLAVNEPSNFMLPVFDAASTAVERIQNAGGVTDQIGTFRYATATLPGLYRTVIVADKETILVVDRLPVAKSLRAFWYGNGARGWSSAIANSSMERRQVMYIGTSPRVSTCFFDSGIGAVRFTRGLNFSTRIQVYVDGLSNHEMRAGEYGPTWDPTDIPLSGMMVTSRVPARYMVTQIDIRGKINPAPWSLVTPLRAADGSLDRVRYTRSGLTVHYQVLEDGSVIRIL
jgi:hypothetical protein